MEIITCMDEETPRILTEEQFSSCKAKQNIRRSEHKSRFENGPNQH